jgi:hypothetical protein
VARPPEQGQAITQPICESILSVCEIHRPGRSGWRSNAQSLPTLLVRLPMRRRSSASPGLEEHVELIDGGDRGQRDAVRAAEPAALALHPALFVAALMAGLAVERIEAGLPGVQ